MQTIDTTDLDAAPRIVRDNYDLNRSNGRGAARLYLITTYSDGSQWHRTGFVSKTTGHKPAFLLVGRVNDLGSGDVLSGDWKTRNTVVAGVSYGRGYFKPGTDERVYPGRNRYTDPTS